MEYNVLILRSGDWLTANPGECGGIGALATLPELEASDSLDRWLASPLDGESAIIATQTRKHLPMQARLSAFHTPTHICK